MLLLENVTFFKEKKNKFISICRSRYTCEIEHLLLISLDGKHIILTVDFTARMWIDVHVYNSVIDKGGNNICVILRWSKILKYDNIMHIFV